MNFDLTDILAGNETSEQDIQSDVKPTEFDINNLTESQQVVYDKIVALPTIVKKQYPHPVLEGELSDTFGCFRSDTWQEIGGTVKKNYVPPTRAQLISLAMAATEAFEGAPVEVSAAIFRNGYYTTIQPTKEWRVEIAEGDTVFPVLTAQMQFGGTGRDLINLGCQRDMCANLQMMRSVAQWNQRIRHSSDHGNFMEQAINDCSKLAQNFENFIETMKMLNDSKIDFGELINVVFHQRLASIKGDKLPKQTARTFRAIQNRYNAEAEKLGDRLLTSTNTEANAWLAYNAVQGYFQHDANHRVASNKYEQALVANSKMEVETAEKFLLGQLAA